MLMKNHNIKIRFLYYILGFTSLHDKLFNNYISGLRNQIKQYLKRKDPVIAIRRGSTEALAKRLYHVDFMSPLMGGKLISPSKYYSKSYNIWLAIRDFKLKIREII